MAYSFLRKPDASLSLNHLALSLALSSTSLCPLDPLATPFKFPEKSRPFAILLSLSRTFTHREGQPTDRQLYLPPLLEAPPRLLSTPLIFSSSVALSAGTFPTVSFAAWILAWTHIDHWTMLGEPRSPRLRACLVERDVSFAQVLRVASSSCCSPGHDMLFVDVSG